MNILERREAFSESLLSWFLEVKEDFPWRRTTDPWAILVSEVMLQQTQVATVIGKGFYTRFMERFPDVQSISTASEQEILKAWEGLGYYRRVRNLQKTAQAIVEHHAGVFPKDYDALLDLPGVGKYTAGAVSSFAFNKAQALVDANVARLFSRLFNFRERVDDSRGMKQLYSWAEELLDQQEPREYNSALMEIGQKVCRNKNPQCMLCPVREFCATDDPETLPIKKEKKATVLVDEHALWCRNTNGDVLMAKKAEKQRREGMWALPLRAVEEVSDCEILSKSTYAITHHKVTLRVYASDEVIAREDEEWITLEQLENAPVPSPFRRVIVGLLG